MNAMPPFVSTPVSLEGTKYLIGLAQSKHVVCAWVKTPLSHFYQSCTRLEL